MRDLFRKHPHPDSTGHLHTLLDLTEWKNAEVFLLYNPLPGEVDPMPLVTHGEGQNFLFPRIEGGQLSLYRHGARSRWVVGPFGLMEPDPPTWECAELSDVDLALIPGVAFDSMRGRLGRGGGFYDRLLGNPSFRGTKIGLCWAWQLVKSVPREAHDILMDRVITG